MHNEKYAAPAAEDKARAQIRLPGSQQDVRVPQLAYPQVPGLVVDEVLPRTAADEI